MPKNILTFKLRSSFDFKSIFSNYFKVMFNLLRNVVGLFNPLKESFLLDIFYFILKSRIKKNRTPNIRLINVISYKKFIGLDFAAREIFRAIPKKILKNLIYIHENTPATFLNDNYINIIIASPQLLNDFFSRLICRGVLTQYNIGLWFWESNEVPKSWLKTKNLIDEIWVYSDYNLNLFGSLCSNIHKIPFSIDLKVNSSFNRLYFDLPKSPFIFLFTFDAYSSVNRKNPEAVIKAFKMAFKNQKDVFLIIKSTNLQHYKNHEKNLEYLVRGSSNIKIVNKFIPYIEHASLINCCDAYISLHRSEGLGYGMAEAMYLGKPVIATNYSGNLEFMNQENAALVDFKLVPIQKGQYYFIDKKKHLWAEPDIHHAATLMLKIKNDTRYRNKISRQASLDIKSLHSLQQQQEAIRSRLKSISGRSIS